MKKLIIILPFILSSTLACAGNNLSLDEPFDSSAAKVVLVKEFIISDSEYLFICKGYPIEGASGIASDQSAKEAALINAQVIAKQRFPELNVVEIGEIKNSVFDGKEATIEYLVTHKNIKKYLRR